MYDIQQVYACIPKNKLKMTPSSFDSVTYKSAVLCNLPVCHSNV